MSPTKIQVLKRNRGRINRAMCISLQFRNISELWREVLKHAFLKLERNFPLVHQEMKIYYASTSEPSHTSSLSAVS